MSVVARVRLYWNALVGADKKEFQIRSSVTQLCSSRRCQPTSLRRCGVSVCQLES